MTLSLNTAFALAIELINAAQRVTTLVQAAQHSGRDVLSQEEGAAVVRLHTAAMEGLQTALTDLLVPPATESPAAPAATDAPPPHGTPPPADSPPS